MPLYEYHCSICERDFEEFRSIADRHNVDCCGVRAEKIISLPNTDKDKQYEFVTEAIDGSPVQVTSKAQFKKLLKDKGIADASPKECFDQARKCKKQNEVSRQNDVRKRAKVAADKMRSAGVMKEGKEILTKMANSGRR